MCGFAGLLDISNEKVSKIDQRLARMNALIAHRGPDGEGIWSHTKKHIGLSHRRLSIIDLSSHASQPMHGQDGNTIAFNGEIYNYIELREELKEFWNFKTNSDTETILAAYAKWGSRCVNHLRGMFAFAIWDEKKQRLFIARDRFGIKPLYYTKQKNVLYFASEAKALLPFLHAIETDSEALAEYLSFQYTISEKTLFKGIYTLMPGHILIARDKQITIRRYWDVNYVIDYDHSPKYFENRFNELLEDSLKVHLRSDVPVGGYISGGMDSSLIALLAAKMDDRSRLGFHGRFTDYKGYDESNYAQLAADKAEMDLHIADITAQDFKDNIANVIYHLDFPVAGPGSFPQYMVSKLAGKHLKVVLGGQGGDELLGGYARYLIAYLEQCIKAAVNGTYKEGNYLVTIESIIPNLGLLREYQPMMKELWREGLFDELDARYFRLVDRSTDMQGEVDWSQLDKSAVFEKFKTIFNNKDNVRHEAYFDKMTHFDFKCLLPALLQVEDRMSMAHGLESRVPLLDHPLVEFLATVPADVKFKNGQMKRLMKKVYGDQMPQEIVNRRDKMGFPVPLKEWMGNELNSFIKDIFLEQKSKNRAFFNTDVVLKNFADGGRFSRKTWGLLSLELWHQQFHDRQAEYKFIE